MFHNKKETVHRRFNTLKTHIQHALQDGALTTVEIAWHISGKGAYPTCAGEVGALLAKDFIYECDVKGHWRLKE